MRSSAMPCLPYTATRSEVKAFVESVFGTTEELESEELEEESVMGLRDEQDDVLVIEPILPQRDVKLEIAAAESAEWKVKGVGEGGAPGHEGELYPAMKLTLTITDPSVQTEHETARPRLVLEHQLNLVKYPYLDKKSGTVKWLGRQSLHELEEAFGFDPIFLNGDGHPIEPHVTRAGRKVAPRGEGIKRQANPEFIAAYFTSEDKPNLEWAGKTVWADIGIEESEQFGNRNRILRFKPKPAIV